jgi:uncharacterized membrane protein
MKDTQIQTILARVMLGGTLLAGAVMGVGLVWYLASHVGLRPGDQVFSGEPKFFENPVSMVVRACTGEATGQRRSLIMIGAMLLLINPVVRVALAAVGFALQKDRLYTAVSVFVFSVLLFSFFW